MIFQDTVKLAAYEKGASDITSLINDIIRNSGIDAGICQLYLHSSNASLLINDTVDDATKRQTMEFLAQLAPTSDEISSKIDRNMDELPENVRNLVTQNSLSFPVKHKRALLGTWRGIYLWECTEKPVQRSITITIIGE
jgi:secondary thiamine-phosphate synthase enzyme